MSKLTADVLIVDIDRERRDKLLNILENAQYSLRTCATFEEAQGLLQEIQPALVVAEALSEPAKSLRLLASAKEVGVSTVFYGEDASALSVVDALRAGVTDFVLEPITDTPGFIEVVARALASQNKVSQIEGSENLGSQNLGNNQQRASYELTNSELQRHLRALESDQRAGRLVQRKLMPDTPAELAGIRIAYQIVPSLYLSGDAVDFGLFGKRYVAFYLLDVSGHSAASAFVAVWVKQIVRGFFKGVGSRTEQKPLNAHIPDLMSHINRQLIEAEIGQHLTAFVGVIDTETLDFSYVVAGHLPLPLLVSGEEVVEVSGEGKPLGIFADAEWSLSTLTLPGQFSLVVCSDGVFELLPEGDLVSKESHFKQLINNALPSSLEQLEALLVKPETDPLPDDVALLLLSKS